MNIIKEHINVMSLQNIGIKHYDFDVLIRAFEYFVTSWSLYYRLRDDFKLPRMRILSALTSKVSKLND